MGIDWEGDRDLEGLRSVDALSARAVLGGGPVAGAVPAVPTTAVAFAEAVRVPVAVHGGAPGVPVGLLHVDLGAGLAADTVRITVVVRTLREPLVVAHGGKVERSIAPAARPGDVCRVAERLPEQLQPQVLAVVVDARFARLRKVCPALNVRHNLPAADDVHRGACIPRSPASRHQGNLTMARHVERAWADFLLYLRVALPLARVRPERLVGVERRALHEVLARATHREVHLGHRRQGTDRRHELQQGHLLVPAVVAPQHPVAPEEGTYHARQACPE
mmetsp:Transcript_52453/g.162450  ORF Transcript_52453/g.162450 Transcript_52453/m.162450 type:complete len:277 (+) Transcript_52453:818-1648(+)